MHHPRIRSMYFIVVGEKAVFKRIQRMRQKSLNAHENNGYLEVYVYKVVFTENTLKVYKTTRKICHN